MSEKIDELISDHEEARRVLFEQRIATEDKLERINAKISFHWKVIQNLARKKTAPKKEYM